MENFIKDGINKNYISRKPKRQQLYFLYKLMMNRKRFEDSFKNRLFNCLVTPFFCCPRKFDAKKKQNKLSIAHRQEMMFQKGQRKLQHDLDIVRIIENQQLNDIHNQVFFDPNERFFLQWQRRNVIESNSDSMQEQRQFQQKTNWKKLIGQENRQEN